MIEPSLIAAIDKSEPIVFNRDEVEAIRALAMLGRRLIKNVAVARDPSTLAGREWCEAHLRAIDVIALLDARLQIGEGEA